MVNDKNKNGVPQATYEKLKKEKAAVAQDFEQLKVKNAAIIAEKKNLEDTIQSMKVDHEKLQTKYSTLKGKINGKRERIAVLVNQVETLNSKVENLVGVSAIL